jgi:hypothetical protein
MKGPKKKLSHLHFGPVGGGKRQNLIRQPRPRAFFVEGEQGETPSLTSSSQTSSKMGFSCAKASGPKADRGCENLAIAL